MRRLALAMRRWVIAIVIGTIGWISPARADDRHTICGRTVDDWIGVLRDKRSRERGRASQALSFFGPEAREAVPDLIEMLWDDPFRNAAVHALGRIGPDAAAAVPPLIERFLKEGCLHLTGRGSIGFSPLVKDTLVRIGGPAVPGLRDVLTGPNREMRACAAEALGEIGPPACSAVPALLRALQVERAVLDDPIDHALRRHAAEALGRIGPDARAAVPALNALLDSQLRGNNERHSDERLIVDALDGLGEPPIAKLFEHFFRTDDSIAGFELTRLGPRARGAIPALRKALNDRSSRVRIGAAIALTAIDPPAPDAVRVLIDALDPYQEEAGEAPAALGRLGPAAEAALPVLIGLVNKGSAGGDVIEALARIDVEGKLCLPALIAVLNHEDPDDVDVAARALGLLGPRAKPAVPALVATLGRKIEGNFPNGRDPIVDTVKALGRIGPEARSAIPALIEVVKSRRVVPAVIATDEDQFDNEGPAAAARVLGAFGAQARDAVPALIDILRNRVKDNDNWQVRRECALALGRIGADARGAVPILRKVVEEGTPPTSPVPDVRDSDAAVVALFYLVPDGKSLAEAWAERSASPERKAFVLGAMGKTSFEAEVLVRLWVERMDRAISAGEREGDETLFVEEFVDRLGLFGVGGRFAIPRLTELRQHRNPWIRQWANEAMRRIMNGDQ